MRTINHPSHSGLGKFNVISTVNAGGFEILRFVHFRQSDHMGLGWRRVHRKLKVGDDVRGSVQSNRLATVYSTEGFRNLRPFAP